VTSRAAFSSTLALIVLTVAASAQARDTQRFGRAAVAAAEWLRAIAAAAEGGVALGDARRAAERSIDLGTGVAGHLLLFSALERSTRSA
jgi:hypothetical protein